MKDKKIEIINFFVKILYSVNELDIIIRTLRINSLDATLYDWYDPIQQRSTSPPPGNYLSNDVQLPYFERTVQYCLFFFTYKSKCLSFRYQFQLKKVNVLA